MAMKPCRECGHEVSTSAKTCPNCGVRHPAGSKGAVLGCLGLLVLIGMCSFLMDDTTTTSTSSPTASSTASGSMVQQAYAPRAVNIRKGPGTEYPVVRTLQARETVFLGDKTENGWRAVHPSRLAKDTVGYVREDLVVLGSPPPLPDLQVLETRYESERYGPGWIVGKVKNNTGRSYSYVQVEIAMYDKQGNLVGSTLDNVNHLAPGQIWNFRAPLLDDRASRYRVVRVTGF